MNNKNLISGKSILFTGTLLSLAALYTVLFVPPVRDRFFSTKMWPWPLPWDIKKDELERIKNLSRPGDILIESNLHGWQWIALCLATTGTSWVHAAIVAEDGNLITVEKEAIRTSFDIYLRWGSTRLALLRPDYESAEQINKVLTYAASKLGTSYDPSFNDPAGNCNGLVASSLLHGGLTVPTKKFLGKKIFAPDSFLHIDGIKVIR